MALNPFSRYPTKVAAGTSAYPYGVPRNVTTPGDGTGTPWEEDIVKDIFGLQQELLNKAGITPSGTADAVGASQYLDGIRKTKGYPGEIGIFGVGSPGALGLRVLELDGSGILAANYPDLVSATWCGVILNPTNDAFFRADNANGTSRNTSGAYLILPDMRGKFLRGYDPTAENDPDGASREIGDNQAYAALAHHHDFEVPAGPYNLDDSHDFTGGGPYQVLQPGGGGELMAANMLSATAPFNILSNVSTAETRPVNVSFVMCIWY